MGPVWVKWECHTEFVTYTAILAGLGDAAFNGSEFDIFPVEWLAELPGRTLTSTSLRLEAGLEAEVIENRLSDWFVLESLAVSRVLDNAAVIAGDYRVDNNGHIRFAIFVPASTGRRRVGRIVQRLNEIEVYKTMSMLGLFRARELSTQLNLVDADMSALVSALADDQVPGRDLERVWAGKLHILCGGDLERGWAEQLHGLLCRNLEPSGSGNLHGLRCRDLERDWAGQLHGLRCWEVQLG